MSESVIPKNQRSLYARFAMIIEQQLKNAEIRERGGTSYSHGFTLSQNKELFEELYMEAAKIIFQEKPSEQLMADVKERIANEFPDSKARLAQIYQTINSYYHKLGGEEQSK